MKQITCKKGATKMYLYLFNVGLLFWSCCFFCLFVFGSKGLPTVCFNLRHVLLTWYCTSLYLVE